MNAEEFDALVGKTVAVNKCEDGRWDDSDCIPAVLIRATTNRMEDGYTIPGIGYVRYMDHGDLIAPVPASFIVSSWDEYLRAREDAERRAARLAAQKQRAEDLAQQTGGHVEAVKSDGTWSNGRLGQRTWSPSFEVVGYRVVVEVADHERGESL